MSTPEWITALELFMTQPVLLIATFLVAVAAFGFAWWLRSQIAQGRVEALDGQLKLMRDQYDAVNRQLSEVTAKVAAQEQLISTLRSSLPPPARVEELARSNTEIQSALTNLATSTGTLGHTITIGEGLYHVMVEPLTRRST
jgi:cell division protein FtsB